MNKQLDVGFLKGKLNPQLISKVEPSANVILKRILTINCKMSLVYYNLGVNLSQQKNYPKAEKLFKRELMLNPTEIDAHFNLGVCFLKQNDINQASKAFQKVIDLDPTCYSAFHASSRVLFEMGDIQKAREQIEKVLKRRPQDPNANNSKGFFLLIQQCYEEAINHFKTAIENQVEKSAYEWINWSMTLWQQEKKEEAMEIFKKGVSLIQKIASPEDEKQEIIQTYTQTQMVLKKKALPMTD